MENLFKKGFVSLALAGALSSSAFAGNAAYIDVKVNYLGGTGQAVLGYEGSKKLDQVELLVSVLDSDGEYATKNSDGSEDIDVLSITKDTGTVVTSVNNSISRDLDPNNNIERFKIDYTNFKSTADLVHTITLTSGDGNAKIEREIDIKLGSVDAKGLIVRATPFNQFKTEKYINENFADINITNDDDNELNSQSRKSPGGLVGLEIPLQVYASTLEANSSAGDEDDYNSSVDGNFTLAPNLDGKIIVVQALADYNENNTTNTFLNSVELVMQNGQATGKITITNALPGSIAGGTKPSNDDVFELDLDSGLGIAFIAYVKDEQSINNYDASSLSDSTSLSSFSIDDNITDWGNSTDTIQVRSGEPAMIKIGSFDKSATKISDLWNDTSSTIFIADGNETDADDDGDVSDINGSHEEVVTLTIVDSFGNPVNVSGGNTPSVTLGGSENIVEKSIGEITDSSFNVTITDSEDKNDTTTIQSVDATISVAKGDLAAVDPIVLTIKTLPLIEVTKDGGSNWKKFITDINTTGFGSGKDTFAKTSSKVIRVTENDFTIKLVSYDNAKGDNATAIKVYIEDKTGEDDYLSGTDLSNYKIGIVDTGGAGALTTKTVDNATNISDGYQIIELNSSSADTYSFRIEINTSTSNVANIVVTDYEPGTTDVDKMEEEIVINIPAQEDKNINAYVEAYIDAEAWEDDDHVKPGTIVNFKFSGTAVSTGDIIEIKSKNIDGFTGSSQQGSEKYGRIGLVDEDISSSNSTKVALPEDGIVSIVLYDTNATSIDYNITSDVTINGIKPVWLYLNQDEDTDDIIELTEEEGITVKPSDDSTITYLNVNVSGSSDSGNDGSADDSRMKIPETTTSGSIDAIILEDEVQTGLYYGIFENSTDITSLDKYKNPVEDDKNIKKDFTFTATSGLEVDNGGEGNSYVFFKDEAAGTEQTLTISYEKDDGSLVSNTVTWTNIKLSRENAKLLVTSDFDGFKDPNTGYFEVVNSEIIIKVIGDGNKKQSSTKITLSHENKDATLRLVKVSDLTSNGYTSALSGLDDSITTSISEDGSYFIVSTDTAGTMTITATATSKDDDDEDVEISGTHSLTFDAIDVNAPMVEEKDVVANAGSIETTVNDENLNTVDTMVTIEDINGNKIKDAEYVNGKYIASGLASDTYQISISAVDMAGNTQNFNFARNMGEGAASEETTATRTLLATGTYTVAGTFSSHDFADVGSAYDWVYTSNDGVVYQLLGSASTDADPFGWKEVADVVGSDTNVWYMVNMGTGRFDWALANKDGLSYKLSGVKADGTFKFTGRLNLNASYTDGKLTFTAK